MYILLKLHNFLQARWVLCPLSFLQNPTQKSCIGFCMCYSMFFSRSKKYHLVHNPLVITSHLASPTYKLPRSANLPCTKKEESQTTLCDQHQDCYMFLQVLQLKNGNQPYLAFTLQERLCNYFLFCELFVHALFLSDILKWVCWQSLQKSWWRNLSCSQVINKDYPFLLPVPYPLLSPLSLGTKKFYIGKYSGGWLLPHHNTL